MDFENNESTKEAEKSLVEEEKTNKNNIKRVFGYLQITNGGSNEK